MKNMFSKKTYTERRRILKEKVGKGLILFFGNDESSMNYADNTYHFRQDSNFLYYFGIQHPGLAAIIDIENDNEIIFGDDYTIDDIVFMGPKPTIAERAELCGVANALPVAKLGEELDRYRKNGTQIHFLPLYRPEAKIRLHELLGIAPRDVSSTFSVVLVKAIVSQREIKTEEEIGRAHV